MRLKKPGDTDCITVRAKIVHTDLLETFIISYV